MKCLIIILFLIPSLAFAAYTEFYCESTGSNVNGGSNTGAVHFGQTNGNWNGSTIYTVTNGHNPVSDGAVVGDFASVYIDGATVAVFIARVTAVQNATNGTITVSSTAKAGAAPTSSATARSIQVGGAWLGPNAASAFPWTLATLRTATNSTGNRPRVNLKNDASYNISTVMNLATNGGNTNIEGYTSALDDGGRATLDTQTNTNGLISQVSSNVFKHLIFTTSATSGSTDLVTTGANPSIFEDCIFKGGRTFLLVMSGSSVANECEFYDGNKSNAVTTGAINMSGASWVTSSYIHDITGSNSSGILANSGGMMNIETTTIEACGAHGVLIPTGNSGKTNINQCNFYNNTGDGVHSIETSTSTQVMVRNCNFLKNASAINNSSLLTYGFIDTCYYGAGTQANTGADTLNGWTTRNQGTYASNVAPWTAPTTGNFSSLMGTVGIGRGVFVETQNSKTGTVGYPSVGAAQAPTPTATPTATFTPTATATATSTATATFTPTATATASFTPCAPTPGPTATATPTMTPTATASATSTATPTPTAPIEMSYAFPGMKPLTIAKLIAALAFISTWVLALHYGYLTL